MVTSTEVYCAEEESMLKENDVLSLELVGNEVARDSHVENQQVVLTCFAEPNAKISSGK